MMVSSATHNCGWRLSLFKLRRDEKQVTPDYEDTGLFRGGIVQLQTELTPQMTANGRADMLVQGYLTNGKPVEVVFAGRRRLVFNPLQVRLRAVQRKYELALAKAQGPEATDNYPLTDVRLPVLFEGAWRTRFELDRDGFQNRQHQFVAARWVFSTETGLNKTYGTLPISSKAAI